MRLGHIGHLPRRFSGHAGVAPVAGSLFEALKTYLKANVPGLADVYRRESPAKVVGGGPPPEPFCIYNVLGEDPDWANGTPYYPAWLDIQLTFAAKDDLAAEAVRDAAYALLTPRRNSDGTAANLIPAFDGGGVPPFGVLPGRKTEVRNDGRFAAGNYQWMMSFPVRVYVTRPV